MKIRVKIRTNQKIESVYLDGVLLCVDVKELPIAGRANNRMIELIAQTLEINKRSISITAGAKYKLKTVDIKTSESNFFDKLG